MFNVFIKLTNQILVLDLTVIIPMLTRPFQLDFTAI